MDLTQLKKFIDKAELYLNEIPDDIIDKYVLNEFNLPIYFDWYFDYETLTNLYFKITQNTEHIRELLLHSSEEINENLLTLNFKLFNLRRIVENQIRVHPLDKGKFSKENNPYTKEESDKINFFELPKKQRNKRPWHIITLFRILVSENRIKNTPNQRKAFISLFYTEKSSTTKIEWYSLSSDLRGFFEALIDENISIYNPSDINQFAYNNFKSLDKQGRLSNIKKNTFKSYQTKTSTLKSKDYWTGVLRKYFK